MKTYGGVEIHLHAFLTNSSKTRVFHASVSLTDW